MSIAQSLFKASKPIRSFEDVVRQIQDAILTGEVLPGDRLASERELCQVFGVSRPTLREALRHLEAQGSVEVVLGSTGGVFIATPGYEQAADALDVLVRFHDVTARDLEEFRPGFESETAMWAARRRDEQDLVNLRSILNELEVAVSDPQSSWGTISALDLRFHDAVTHASKNRLRVAIMAAVYRAVQRASLSIADALEQPARESILRELAAIVAAISDRDEVRSGALMASHVKLFSSLESAIENKARDDVGGGRS